MAAVDQAARQRVAYTLRLAGLTWAEIASHEYEGGRLYSNGTAAWRAAKTYRESSSAGDDLMSHRELDMDRFDALQRAMWRKAIGGDLPAAKFVLALMRARQEMLGLKGYTPPEQEVDPLDELAARREQKA